MNYLITGYGGFVGPHMAECLISHDKEAVIYALDIIAFAPAKKSMVPITVDLLSERDTLETIRAVRPHYVIHLASMSSVGDSWKDPLESFKNNTNIFLNVLEAIRRVSRETTVLSVGSSEEYGTVAEKDMPITEDIQLRPSSPYAVARVAQENLSQIYWKGFDLRIICTRSFNHIGRGQAERFVISSLAKQFAEAVLGNRKEIVVGDTEIIRDFVDVRDVVAAYFLLLRKGRTGQVYNICGGVGYKLLDIIDIFRKMCGVSPAIRIDESLLRPIENRVVVGSASKIRSEIGWRPRYELRDSLAEVYRYWLDQLSVKTEKSG